MGIPLRILVFCLGLAVAAPGAKAADLTIYAAASLRGALEEVGEIWTAETGGELTLVYAGSSALARQIQAGAPADLFFSANVAWMQATIDSGHVDETSRADLLTNRLVLIGGWYEDTPIDLGDPTALPDRLGRGRLALALTEAVPAGIYAREALDNLGLWEGVADQVIEADNVRAALMLVALRAADMGVVYASDVLEDRRVVVVADIPESSHVPILYPIAATSAGDSDGAGRFIRFLQTPLPRAIFTGHGFGLIGEG